LTNRGRAVKVGKDPSVKRLYASTVSQLTIEFCRAELPCLEDKIQLNPDVGMAYTRAVNG